MSKVRSIKIRGQITNAPLMQNALNAVFTALVIACFFVFFNFFEFSIFGYHFLVPAACVPYTFLYPISYVALRLYGYRQINNMILSMFIASIAFFVMVGVLHYLSNFDLFVHNHQLGSPHPSELTSVIHSSVYMYVSGLFAMPLSLYVAFYIIKLLKSFNNFITLSIGTAVGEVVNTYIVLPIGMHEHFSFNELFSNVVVSATIFKVVIGVLLSIATVLFLKVYE